MRRSLRGGFTAFAVAIAVLIAMVSLSSCSMITDTFDGFFQKDPVASTTYFDMKDVNARIESELKAGNKEISLDIAASTETIKNITENFSPFWGLPVQYVIQSSFNDIIVEGASEKGPVDIVRVTFTLEQSLNYYVYNAYKDPNFAIPNNKKEAIAIFAVLPEIIAYIFGEEGNGNNKTDYESVLAVHDWLVSNLTYNSSLQESDISNGSYGALVNKSTMCKGYTEAMQLILNCATNVEVISVVGEGNDNSSGWVGHAWNMVKMDDQWYQIDATFDDPVNNKVDRINHYYFGQNDTIMKQNHRWSEEYWPKASAADFYYYRTNGLYARSYEDFQNLVRSQLRSKQPQSIEIATEGFTLSDKDLQFIFSLNYNIETLYRSETKFGDITVVTITPAYK
jgi:hypothetical protein